MPFLASRIEVRFKVGKGSSNIAFASGCYLAGNFIRGTPPLHEKVADFFRFRSKQFDRLKAGLEAFGQIAQIQVTCPDECPSSRQLIQVGQKQILRIP
jgi:hypothetical protein